MHIMKTLHFKTKLPKHTILAILGHLNRKAEARRLEKDIERLFLNDIKARRIVRKGKLI